MSFFHRAIAVAGIVVLGTQALVCGQWQSQSNRNSATSGMFGSRSLGSTLNPGNRTFGRNPMPGSMGTAAMGTAAMGNVGQVDSSDRFVRGNRRPGQFVGSDTQDIRNFLSAMSGSGASTRGSSSGLSARGSSRSRNPNRSSRNRTAGGRQPVEIRTSLHVAFDHPKPVPAKISLALRERLEKSPRLQIHSPLEVLIEDATAILRGVVATEHDRDLAEQLVRLEAGIWHVKNELIVGLPPVGPELPKIE